MKVVKCKFCGAPIVWIKTQNGRSMPCDANTIQYQNARGGKDVIVTPEGKVIRAAVIRGGGVLTPIPDGEGYISHFATCPHANEARRPKPTTAPTKPTPLPVCTPDDIEAQADEYERIDAARRERQQW